MLAYTIVGQNKNIYVVDAICELVDFLRFNVAYADQIIGKQPIQTKFNKNISEYTLMDLLQQLHLLILLQLVEIYQHHYFSEIVSYGNHLIMLFYQTIYSIK